MTIRFILNKMIAYRELRRREEIKLENFPKVVQLEYELEAFRMIYEKLGLEGFLDLKK